MTEPTTPRVLPHGSWPTPITSELVVRAAARLGEVGGDGDDVWWAEGRPSEGGRTALVRRSADGTTADLLPPPCNARTRVHEYGGGAWTVAGGTVWFTGYADQRLHRVEPGGEPVAVAPEPALPAGVRFADLRVTPDGAAVLAVRETHAASGAAADVVHEVVAGSTPRGWPSAGLGRWLHDAGGAHLPPRGLRRRRQSLRRRRPRRTGRRHALPRVAVPRRADRPVARER